jgi:hypothetical protein
MAFDPLGALLGVADRVERGAVDVDTVEQQTCRCRVAELQRCRRRRRGVDAADQQAFALAGLEEVECRVEPRLAAGENDDGVGLGRVGRRRVSRLTWVANSANPTKKRTMAQATRVPAMRKITGSLRLRAAASLLARPSPMPAASST